MLQNETKLAFNYPPTIDVDLKTMNALMDSKLAWSDSNQPQL